MWWFLIDSIFDAAYVLNRTQHGLHFNQQCAKVTNLVFCCITAVLFLEESLLWLETFRRILIVILWYKCLRRNFVHFFLLVLWVCYQQCTERTRGSWFFCINMIKVTAIIIQAHHCYQQGAKFYQNSSVKINSISRQKFQDYQWGIIDKFLIICSAFERYLNITWIHCSRISDGKFITFFIAVRLGPSLSWTLRDWNW
jgi:hypothetical protein